MNKNYFRLPIYPQRTMTAMNFETSYTTSCITDHLDSYYAIIDAGVQMNMYEIENARGGQCRQAMRTRWCGGISAELTFLLLFWSRKKVEEENMKLPNKQAQKQVYLLCRAKGSWVKPTYGRLYDPVIARFFSPDNFVQLPEFTQGFNRYSYCLNNPLSYIDPSGDSFLESSLNFLTFPARVLSEGFQWINDKMNGITRPNGYFNWSYLNGQTEPGAPFKTYAANQVPYGHPFYMEPSAGISSISLGTGFSLCADNEWSDYTLHKFYEHGYIRKEGSKKLMWISRRAAASGGIAAKALGKLIFGTYVGKIEGVNVYEAVVLGKWSPYGGYSGVTVPERGIVVGLGVFVNDKDMMMHEFGHILQYRVHGARAYWSVIAPESFLSAKKHGKNGWNHNCFWVETYANYLSRNYFGKQAMNDGWDSFYWNYDEYPVQNISPENLLRLR